MAFSSYLASAPQYVEITIPTSAASATATITAVGSLACLHWGGFNTTETSMGANNVFPRIELTNSTTVTAYRNTASAGGTVTVRLTVMDYSSNFVTSVQHGTIALSTAQTSNTATVSSVGTNSVVLYVGFTCANTGSSPAQIECAVTKTNATTITANRTNSGTAAATVGFTVLEFNPLAIKSVQNLSVTLANTNSVDTQAIASVDTANTLLFFQGWNPSGASFPNTLTHLQLTSATVVTLTRNSVNNNQRITKFTVIEFYPLILNSLQRNITTMGASTPVDTTITAVNLNDAFPNFCGQSTSGTTPDEIFPTVQLFATTTLRAARNTATDAAAPSWEVVELQLPPTVWIKGGNIL